MTEIYIYKNLHSGEVKQVTTLAPNQMISDRTFGWEIVRFDETDINDFVSRNFKWAIPDRCYFHGTIFTPAGPDNLTDEEYSKLVGEEFTLLRTLRNSFLSSSDWTQLPDAPLTEEKRNEWTEYRQALRNLPNNTTNPYIAIWPKKPE